MTQANRLLAARGQTEQRPVRDEIDLVFQDRHPVGLQILVGVLPGLDERPADQLETGELL